MDFRITGLDPAPFRPLFDLDPEALAARSIRSTVSDGSGFPCRISLADAPAGERLLLLQFEHHPVASPYRAAGPIFVSERAGERYDRVGEVPEQLRKRLLSLRAYDREALIVDAEVAEGTELERLVDRFLGNPEVAYVHAHFARHGCYAARIERA